MSSTALIMTVVLASVMLVVVLAPLLDQQPRRAARRGTTRQNQALDTLWTEKLRVLRAIRDLDFDYDLGKLPDSAYQEQRIALIRLAVAITRRIDDLDAEITAQEARIAQAVSSFRRAGKRR